MIRLLVREREPKNGTLAVRVRSAAFGDSFALACAGSGGCSPEAATERLKDRVSVLDPAFSPARPEQPRWRVALEGAILGFLLGIVLELRGPVIVLVDALESLTGLRVLGSLPHMR